MGSIEAVEFTAWLAGTTVVPLRAPACSGVGENSRVARYLVNSHDSGLRMQRCCKRSPYTTTVVSCRIGGGQ